jgi:anti-sigma-K factor RskA
MNDSMHLTEDVLALYAMGSLPADEAEAARQHLIVCEKCQEELSETTMALSFVAAAVKMESPGDGARSRLMAEIGGDEPVAMDARKAPRVARSWNWLWPAAAAIVLAITTVFLVGVNRNLRSQNAQLQDLLGSQQQQIALLTRYEKEAKEGRAVLAMLKSPTVARFTLARTKEARQPMGRAFFDSKSGGLLFVASAMPPLPAGKSYELWMIDKTGDAPVPAGMFQPDTTGGAIVAMPPMPAGKEAKNFAVTIEPEAGSASPTSPVFMASGE